MRGRYGADDRKAESMSVGQADFAKKYTYRSESR